MDTEEIGQVLEAYGADPGIVEEYDCIPIRARQIHDVVKIRTQTGTRMLKRVDMSPDRLRFVFEFTEYMHGQHFPAVPRFIRNRFDDPFIVHATGLYYMTPWHAGREVDLRKPSNLLASVDVLAAWHQTAKGFRPASTKYPELVGMERRLSNSLGEIVKWHKELGGKSELTPFDQLFNACYEELMERINFCLSSLARIGYGQWETAAMTSGEILHGNFRKQNVFFDGVMYRVINYDKVSPGPQVLDLAMLLQRYLPPHDWDPDLVQAVTQNYAQRLGHTDWLEALAALVTAPLRTMQVIQWYYNQVNPWEEEDYVDYLETSLELEEPREVARDAILLLGSRKPTSVSEGTDIVISPDSEFLTAEHLEPTLANGTQRVVDEDGAEPNGSVGSVSAAEGIDGVSIEGDPDEVHEPHQLGRKGENTEGQSASMRRKRRRAYSRRVKKSDRDDKSPKLWQGSIPEQDDDA